MKRIFFSVCILTFCFILSLNLKVYGSHVMGGEVSYQYLGINPANGNIRYAVTLKMFRDWSYGIECPDDAGFEIFNDDSAKSKYGEVTLPRIDTAIITPPSSVGCSFVIDPVVQLCLFYGVIELPNSLTGYHFVYETCCRNALIKNLEDPGGAGKTFYAFISPSYFQNTSPDFTDTLVTYFCKGEETTILNTAKDPDGDILIYSFIQTYDSYTTNGNGDLVLPVDSVPYISNYSLSNPFGPGSSALINASNGLTTYFAPTIGNYVVTVEIREYRNNVLLSKLQRDMQLVVVDCPPGSAPSLLDSAGSGQVIYTIEAGDSLAFPMIFFDAQGDTIIPTVKGEIFDSNYVNPPAKVSTQIEDTLINILFSWRTECDQSRAIPYQFTVKTRDFSAKNPNPVCPVRTKNVVYSIRVNPSQGIGQIFGETLPCSGKNYKYHVNNPLSEYIWTIKGGSIVSGANNDTVTVKWNVGADTSASLELSKNQRCTPDTSILKVKVYEATIATAGNSSAICIGDSLQLGVAPDIGNIYKWTPVTGLSNPNIANPKASPSVSTGYRLTVSKGPPCTINTDDVYVTVNLSEIKIGNDRSICLGDTIQFGLIPQVNIEYRWSTTNGVSDSTISNPDFYPDTTFQYRLKIKDTINLCVAEDTVIIIVSKPANAKAGNDKRICDGDSLKITATGGVSYKWFPNKWMDNPLSANPTMFPDSTINYNLVAFSGVCPSDTDQVKITVGYYPTVYAGVDKFICKGDTVKIGYSYDSKYKYKWTPTTTILFSDSAFAKVFPADTMVYLLTVTRDSICQMKDSVKVFVNSNILIANAGQDAVICPGKAVKLKATGGLTFNWSPGKYMNDSTLAEPFCTPDSTTIFRVRVSSGSCLEDTDSVIVKVSTPPRIDAGNDTILCLGESIFLKPASIVGATDHWWSNGGALNPVWNDTLLYPYSNSEYFLKAINSDNCSSIDSISVSIRYIQFNVGNDTTICLNNSVILNQNPNTNLVYKWLPAPGLNTLDSISPVVKPVETTNYIVRYTDSYTCSNTDTVTVIVLQKSSSANAGEDKIVCDGDTITLIASGGNLYRWTIFTKPSDTVSKSRIYQLVPDSSRKYLVYVSNGSCGFVSDTVSVRVHKMITSVSNDTTVCSGETVKIKATGGKNYYWNPGKGLNDSLSSEPVAKASIDQEYKVTILDTTGCVKIESVKINVFPETRADAGEKLTISESESISLKASGGVKYVWTPSLTLSNAEISDPVASPKVTTTYQVSVTDQNGCIDIDSVTVEVLKIIDAPNVFTPNGDGVGDNFVIKGLSVGSKIFISNRWGKVVYTNDNYFNDWNGTSNDGNKLSAGVYFYVAIPKGKDEPIKGWIMKLGN